MKLRRYYIDPNRESTQAGYGGVCSSSRFAVSTLALLLRCPQAPSLFGDPNRAFTRLKKTVGPMLMCAAIVTFSELFSKFYQRRGYALWWLPYCRARKGASGIQCHSSYYLFSALGR